jgi:hypothetical protein
MRYYIVPGRPVTDPETGEIRPTRIANFTGGTRGTRFTDPETGIEFPAEFVRQTFAGIPTDFIRPEPSRGNREPVYREFRYSGRPNPIRPGNPIDFRNYRGFSADPDRFGYFRRDETE